LVHQRIIQKMYTECKHATSLFFRNHLKFSCFEMDLKVYKLIRNKDCLLRLLLLPNPDVRRLIVSKVNSVENAIK
jgi:hypothetical protein